MQDVTSDTAPTTGLFRRVLGGLIPSLAQRADDEVAKLSLIQSLALGKECHLLLVACGEERYLIGRGKASVDSIVRMESRQQGSATQAGASPQAWRSLTPTEYAKA